MAVSLTKVRNVYRWALFALFTALGVTGFGQGLPMPFQTLTVDDGLPQNSVTAMVQDDRGFVWIGTQDGLARYDGYEFRIFRNERGNPNSLSHNFIWNMTLDGEGIIWITTLGNGLTKLDPVTEKFTQFLYDEREGVGLSHWNTFSSYRKDSILYVGTNESLDRINLLTGKTTTYRPGLELGADSLTSLIRAIVPDTRSGKLWLSTTLGLTLFDPGDGSFEYFRKSPFGTNTSLRRIYTVERAGDKLRIVSALRVLEIDFENASEEVVFDIADLGISKVFSLHGYVVGVEKDYVHSGFGIFEVDKNTGRTTHRYYDPLDRESLPHDQVISMLCTDDGAIWAGTRNGLGTLRTRDRGFRRFGRRADGEFSLLGKSAKAFLQLSDSILMLGTSEGVEIVNIRSGSTSHINDISDKNIPEDAAYILSLVEDGGTIWAGSRRGGITKFRPDGFGKFKMENFPLDGRSVQYILDADSFLWLGSTGGGLLKFSKKGELLRGYASTGDSLGPSHTYVYALMIDSQENFWVGTPTGGINFFDPGQERFVHLNKSNATGLSGNTILCFFEDSYENVWIGTTTGLSKLESPTELDLFHRLESRNTQLAFIHYGRESGFPNEVVYGMVEDDHGTFWISTNEGLVKFDPKKGEVLDVYTREDGCTSNEYNQNAYMKLANGFLVFGGVSGFQVFHPDSLSSLLEPPKVVLTSIEVNKEPFDFLSNPSEFSHSENDLAFTFAALSYINTDRNAYRYRLKGFDNKWYDRKSIRLVTYTNLDPGSYEFQVMAANSDGVWTEGALTYPFSIGVPPWRTWYAYLAYLFLLALAVYVFVLWRTGRVRREERRKSELQAARVKEREVFRKRSARDFHDEAGNKITRINLLVELAKNDALEKPRLAEYLAKIGRNTTELSRGMRDFNWALDPDKDSLYDLLGRIKIFGESMYEGEDARFEMRGMDEAFSGYKLSMALRRDLLMVFKEAINNAVKHSGSNCGLLEVARSAGDVELAFYDFGKGYAEGENTQGYGLKNMKARASKHGLRFEMGCDDGRGTWVKVGLIKKAVGG